MRPLAGHYTANFMSCPGFAGYLLHIEIPKSKDILKASDGHPYIRKGAQKLRVDTDEARYRLRLDKGIVSFEDEVVNAALEGVTDSVAVINFMLGEIPKGDSEAWLRKQQLIVGDRPTVAGVMLFHDEPQSALPKRTGVKIYRYKTRDDAGTREQLAGDPITIGGCAYNLIYEAVRRTKEIVQGIRKLTHKGLETVLYPDATLHEIITNAYPTPGLQYSLGRPHPYLRQPNRSAESWEASKSHYEAEHSRRAGASQSASGSLDQQVSKRSE